jgi:hypothetical protein
MNGANMAQAQAGERQLVSFGKALQKELSTRPKLPPKRAAQVQGATYRQHITRGSWQSLAEAATRDSDSAVRQMSSASSYQRRINRLAERADGVQPPPALAAQPAGSWRVDKLKGWRAAAGQAREELVKKGVPVSHARRTITRLGHAELSLDGLTARAKSLSEERGRQLNEAFRLQLRAQAGAAVAAVFAQLNGAPAAAAANAGKAPDYVALERAVHTALVEGRDAIGAAAALQAAGEGALAAAAAKLRRAKAGSESSLDATIAVKSALEAALLGRLLQWRLGWQLPALIGTFGSASDHPFQQERSGVPSLVAAAPSTDGVAGTVTDIGYADNASQLVLDDGSRIVVPSADVRFFGCVAGVYVRLTSATREADGSYRVHFVKPAPIGHDWRETLRQQLRPSFLADPFGLGLRWSWLPRNADSARFLTFGLWFS